MPMLNLLWGLMYEDYGLLGCETKQFGRCPPTNWRQQVHQKCWYPFKKFYGIISQKVIILKYSVFRFGKECLQVIKIYRFWKGQNKWQYVIAVSLPSIGSKYSVITCHQLSMLAQQQAGGAQFKVHLSNMLFWQQVAGVLL